MNVPATALPSVHDLAAALAERDSNSPLRTWCVDDSRTLRLFSRGSGALGAIADAASEVRGRPASVFVPDYFCNQALDVVRRSGHRLHFYPVDDKLEPLWPAIEKSLVRTGAPDLFVMVHYFGFDFDARTAAEFSARQGAWLIEDAAHALRPTATIGAFGDASVYCPWKLLPVPDGAVLCARGAAATAMASATQGTIGGWAMAWVARRLTQRVLCAARVPWTGSRYASFADDPPPVPVQTSSMSRLANRLLARTSIGLDAVSDARRANYRLFSDAIGMNGLLRPLFASLPPLVTPYVFPVLAPADRAAESHAYLNRCGIPSQSWPDLPPEVLQHPEAHAGAIRIRRSLIAVPLHQGLAPSQVSFVAAALDAVSRGRLGRSPRRAA